jgi:hypothetical protein
MHDDNYVLSQAAVYVHCYIGIVELFYLNNKWVDVECLQTQVVFLLHFLQNNGKSRYLLYQL